MAEVIIMPKLGFNMDEGELVKWHDVEDEQWRFFMIVDEDFPALVAYSNRVEY